MFHDTAAKLEKLLNDIDERLPKIRKYCEDFLTVEKSEEDLQSAHKLCISFLNQARTDLQGQVLCKLNLKRNSLSSTFDRC
jgi:hypothetical protein